MGKRLTAATNAINKVTKQLAENKVVKSAAKSNTLNAKASYLQSKAKLATAKQANKIVGNIARNVSASVASSAAAKVEVAKANAANQTSALAKWNALINQNSNPAEGTGTAETNTGDSSTSSTTNPVSGSGNSAR